MVDETGKNIDTKQGQISGLQERAEKKEGAEALAEKLKKKSGILVGSVDGAQEIVTQAQTALKKEGNRMVITSKAQAIDAFLGSVVSKGESIYKASNKDTPAAGVESIDGYTQHIDNYVKEINGALPFLKEYEKAEIDFYDNAIPALKEVDALLSDMKLGPVEKKDKLVAGANGAIDKIAAAKRTMKQANAGGDVGLEGMSKGMMEIIDSALEKMADIKLYYEVRDFAESDKYKEYFSFDEKTGQVKKLPAFDKLPEKKQQEILLELNFLKMKIGDEIGEKCAVSEAEKGYFKGKKLMAEGKHLEAKKYFLAYVKKLEDDHVKRGVPDTWVDDKGQLHVDPGPWEWDGKTTEEEDAYFETAETLLKQIGLMEVAQARKRFVALKQSINAQWHDLTGENTLGLTAPESKIYLDKMGRIIGRAEKLIEDGKVWSIEGAIQELKTMELDSSDYDLRTYQQGFWNGRNRKRFRDVFDVLSIQAELNDETDPEKRGEIALREARKAYDLGMFALARMYYDDYFEPAFQESADRVDRKEIEKQMRGDDDLNQQMWKHEQEMSSKVKEQYHKAHGHPISDDQLEEILRGMKEKMFQMAVDRAYQKACKAITHRAFSGDMSTEMSREWNKVNNNVFVNLEYSEDRSWYEMWKFTEEEWDGFTTTLLIDVGLLIVSMGAGNVAKTAVTRTALRILAEQGVKETVIIGAEKALQQGFRHYCKYIVKELGWKKAMSLGLLSVGVESGVTTVANGAMQTVVRNADFQSQVNFQSWGKMALMMTISKGFAFGFGGKSAQEMASRSTMKKTGETLLEVALEEGTSTGFDILLMMASGETITDEKVRQLLRDNVVYAAGMPAGMRLSQKATAPEVPKISGADKKIRLKGVELALGVDFSKPGSIKSAQIAADGTVLVNGKPAFTKDSLGALPKKARQRIESLAGEHAKTPEAPSANVAAFKKKVADMELPEAQRKHVDELIAKFEKAELNGKELDAAVKASFNESRKVLIPDPDNPGKMKEVDLHSDYKTKNFAYSPEMTTYLNDHAKLKADGPIIVKHGGDEIVILHAGPDGKTQMYFGDVGNMGPTNEFSLRVKGGDANLVDLYLRDLAAVMKAEFVPGKEVNGQAVLDRIKNQLAKKYFGIETEAAFNALKKQYNLDGTWADYQRNMSNANILAGFRSDARGLQAEFIKQYPEANSAADPVRDNQQFADFIGQKIDALDSGSPPLTDVLRDNLDVLAESGALKDLLPDGLSGSNSDVLTKDGLAKILKKKNRTAEEQLIVYFALRRVNSTDMPPISGVDSGRARKRFAAIRQSADAVTLMDFQMAGVEVPAFKGRDFNHTDMKFFLDKVLEDGLHKAKEQKGVADIMMVKSPFDESGNLPKAEDAKDYAKAAEDTKPEQVDEFLKLKDAADAKLGEIRAQIEKMSAQEKPSRADVERLVKLKSQYDKLVGQMNQRKFSDPETGVDRPAKFAEDADVWLRSQKGEKIPPERQMMREFVFDLHNTGAINAQRGYAVTDAAMAALALQIKASFPGVSAVVRSGGGQLRVYYFDTAGIPKVDGQPMSFAQHQAHMEGQLANLSQTVSKTIEPTGSTGVDGIVRDATSRMRSKQSEGSAPVGQVKLTGQSEVNHKDFRDRLKAAKPPASLFKIREYRGGNVNGKPAEADAKPPKKEAA